MNPNKINSGISFFKIQHVKTSQFLDSSVDGKTFLAPENKNKTLIQVKHGDGTALVSLTLRLAECWTLVPVARYARATVVLLNLPNGVNYPERTPREFKTTPRAYI